MYRWNEEKNELLLSQRGVSFHDVLYELENNGVIDTQINIFMLFHYKAISIMFHM